MLSCRNDGMWFAGALLLLAGCSSPTPEKKLLGKWNCTPRVEEAVSQAINAAAQGQKVNPLAQGAAQFFGQKLAEATMSVEVDFRSGGIVFFRGNTSALSLPPDSDGMWELSSSNPDALELRFGTESRQLQGKLLFRDNDEFTLKLKDAGALSPAAKTEDVSKTQKPSQASLVFKRKND